MAEECIFCKIASGQMSSEVIYEDDKIKAFNDVNPLAPVHVLIVPKKHIPTLNNLTGEDADLISHMLLTAAKVAREKGIDESGYRVTFNVNPEGGQVIFHLHLHVMGGRKLGNPAG